MVERTKRTDVTQYIPADAVAKASRLLERAEGGDFSEMGAEQRERCLEIQRFYEMRVLAVRDSTRIPRQDYFIMVY